MIMPLVSVICVCFNHERFVAEAIESVFAQTYSNLEVILVDDHSTDNSRTVISELLDRYPSVMYIPMERNGGICKAFNLGLSASSGAYIVDLAADDIFLPERIARQISLFESLDDTFGVVFTDAEYIDEKSRTLYSHFEKLLRKKLIQAIPSGDVYIDLIRSYFISAPSMLVRREVFERLGGYDESLAYEDFDFWIRSSRDFKYAYLNEVLTRVRKTPNSLASRAYSSGDLQLHSTYLVCRKAQQLNRSEEERIALAARVRYELRHAVWTGNYHEAELFLKLLKELTALDVGDVVLHSLMKARLPLAWARRLYHKLRYR